MKRYLLSSIIILGIPYFTLAQTIQSSNVNKKELLISEGRYVFTPRAETDDKFLEGYVGVLTDSKTGRVWIVSMYGMISIKYYGDEKNLNYYPEKLKE